MRHVGSWALALMLVSAGSAQAADYYFGGIVGEDDPQVLLVDPATIQPSTSGNKTAEFYWIGRNDFWTDEFVEMDCTASRWRVLHAVDNNEGADGAKELQRDDQARDWDDLEAGSFGAHMRDMVCKYPAEKPTGDDVFPAANRHQAIQQASEALETILADQKNKK